MSDTPDDATAPPPRNACAHCGDPTGDAAYCLRCEDASAAFRFLGGPEQLYDFFAITVPIVVVREDLGGRLSEYRGLRLVEGAPRSAAAWDAVRDVPAPTPGDFSPEAHRRRVARWEVHMRHVIALDERLTADLAGCRLWHEAVHAANREADPLHPAPCREQELDALFDRYARRDWPGPRELGPFREELQARKAESLAETFGGVVANRRVTLPPADVAAPRIVRAEAGAIMLHPDHAAFAEAYARRVRFAWELEGHAPDGGDRAWVPTLQQHLDWIDLEASMREALIELGLDPDARDARDEPADPPEPPEPDTITFGGVVAVAFPGMPEEVLAGKPSLRDLFGIVLAEDLPAVDPERRR